MPARNRGDHALLGTGSTRDVPGLDRARRTRRRRDPRRQAGAGVPRRREPRSRGARGPRDARHHPPAEVAPRLRARPPLLPRRTAGPSRSPHRIHRAASNDSRTCASPSPATTCAGRHGDGLVLRGLADLPVDLNPQTHQQHRRKQPHDNDQQSGRQRRQQRRPARRPQCPQPSSRGGRVHLALHHDVDERHLQPLDDRGLLRPRPGSRPQDRVHGRRRPSRGASPPRIAAPRRSRSSCRRWAVA